MGKEEDAVRADRKPGGAGWGTELTSPRAEEGHTGGTRCFLECTEYWKAPSLVRINAVCTTTHRDKPCTTTRPQKSGLWKTK